MYADGVNTNTILLGRYGIAAIILMAIMLFQKKSFTVTRKELFVLAPLGFLFSASSVTLYASFLYMDAGIACTILFMYPVMVAIMMSMFFKERITLNTLVSIALALCGIGLLYNGSDGVALSTAGVMLVMVSALTYAVYIIILNKSSLRMSSVKMTFYELLFGIVLIVLNSLIGSGGHIQVLSTPSMWLHASILALFPTVISLMLMVEAVHDVGSTPTAVMGALEPITAVAIGVILFGEVFTPRLATGILMVLMAVILIIVGKSLSIHSITRVIGKFGHVLVKHWRWK